MFEYKVVLNGLPVRISRYHSDLFNWYRKNDRYYRSRDLTPHYFFRPHGSSEWVEILDMEEQG